MSSGKKELPKMKLPILILLLLFTVCAHSQPACPTNLGFENGSFDNWELFTGRVFGNGTMDVKPGSGQHKIYFDNGTPEYDPYGDFPVTAPNGSKYSVRLGHSIPGARVDQLVYSLTVPANAASFSIIFNYAIVLQNPSHQEQEQPRFTVKVYNATRREYLQCSSFDFVAGYNQPDFVVSPNADSVFYKPWSSASINLSSYRGEDLRLEFSVNDCTRGGHFGYAYFDVMERCNNSITGNIICPGLEKLTLQAPPGFAGYQWFTGNFGRRLGTGNMYTVDTPNAGDSFAVVLIPYAYLGCRDTFYTRIYSQNEPIRLTVSAAITGCSNEGADLTKPAITAGSTTNLTLEYYTDSTALTLVQNPKKIMSSGVYYIHATNRAGCMVMKPVDVTVYPATLFRVKDPPLVAFPQTVNLTLLPDNNQLLYTYWEDQDLTRQVSDPSSINQSGVYYIKGTNRNNCSAVLPVTVKVTPRVVVPTAFTPNQDGRNDKFIYLVQGGLKQVRYFKIYNRWGMEVFSSTTLGEGWNGSFRGKAQEPGTYIWQLNAVDWQNNPIVLKGTVVLIR